MLRNYLTVAIRNLLRHKTQSTINIAGLSIGAACCLLIATYVNHERSYDAFHQNADDVYLLYHDSGIFGRARISMGTQHGAAPALEAGCPEVVEAVRVYDTLKGGCLVKSENETFVQSGLHADPGFFRMFSFRWVAGTPEGVFGDLHSVVITDDLARKLFGSVDVVGKTVSLRSRRNFETFVVQGVVEVPSTSSIQFDFLLPYQKAIADGGMTRWRSWNYHTFIQLAPGTDVVDAEVAFSEVLNPYIPEASRGPFKLVPLRQLHLSPQYDYRLSTPTHPGYLYVSICVAIAILVIACVNSINLSLGMSTGRALEVGLRKVLGAGRSQVTRQFWTESVLFAVSSVAIAVGAVELLLPTFGGLVNCDLEFGLRSHWWVLLMLMVMVGLVGGSYPAVILSRLAPVGVFKGAARLRGNAWMNRGLLVVQFVLSVVLVVGTLTMHQQMRFLRSKDLGFDPEQVVVIDTQGMGPEDAERLNVMYRLAAEGRPDILQVSMSNMTVGKGDRFGSGGKLGDREFGLDTYVVDYDFCRTLGLDLVAGREFSEAHPSDEREGILINESLARMLNWSESPVGKQLPMYGKRQILGVVEDMHLRSLRHRVDEAVFTLKRGNGHLRYVLVRIGTERVGETLAGLEEIWASIGTDTPILYSFLGEDVRQLYLQDKQWESVVRASAVIAALVACLGAFGLTYLTVSRRGKEVGIRKAIGASTESLIWLFTREYTALVVVSCLLAWPLAYHLLDQWLSSFAYRADLNALVFACGGALTLASVLVTTGCASLRSAAAAPVDALRCE